MKTRIIVLAILASGLIGCELTSDDSKETVVYNESGQVIVLDQTGKVIEESAPQAELEKLDEQAE